MAFFPAITLNGAIEKTTGNLWNIFDDVGRSVQADIEAFRVACYEAPNAPLKNNAEIVQNLVQRQSLQAWNVALKEVQENPVSNATDNDALVGRSNLYKYIRAVQYMLIASDKATDGLTAILIVNNYNDILAS